MELDGEKKGPNKFELVDIPEGDGLDLLKGVREVIRDRVTDDEINDYINIMALNKLP